MCQGSHWDGRVVGAPLAWDTEVGRLLSWGRVGALSDTCSYLVLMQGRCLGLDYTVHEWLAVQVHHQLGGVQGQEQVQVQGHDGLRD